MNLQSPQAINSRHGAVSTLTHYLSTLWKAAGLNWEPDNDTEIANVIDLAIQAALLEKSGAPEKPLETVNDLLIAITDAWGAKKEAEENLNLHFDDWSAEKKNAASEAHKEALNRLFGLLEQLEKIVSEKRKGS